MRTWTQIISSTLNLTHSPGIISFMSSKDLILSPHVRADELKKLVKIEPLLTPFGRQPSDVLIKTLRANQTRLKWTHLAPLSSVYWKTFDDRQRIVGERGLNVQNLGDTLFVGRMCEYAAKVLHPTK
jgi:hypothetical protein